ncbi:hypothetical protein BT69DRAFT_1288624 [Atractiella rhizophila]|nr:hypothetical protein BT69DRAFT_1288624 [Atractiella rhizophila]
MVSVVRMRRKMRRVIWMRRLTMRMPKAYDVIKSAVSSQKMKALVHVITTNDLPDLIYLSILPSFLSRLPPSARTLWISFGSLGSEWKFGKRPSRLSYLSLERVENVVDKDGAINLRVTIHDGNVTVTFLDVEGQQSAVNRAIKRVLRDSRGEQYCYSCVFPYVRENAIFARIASYSEDKRCFVPVSGHDSSRFPPFHAASIIQLSFPPPHVTSCSISSLPVEVLSLIFSFSDPALTLSAVCKLWKAVAVPYLQEPGSVAEKYEVLKSYPGAGRLWDNLRFNTRMDHGTVKKVIAGSPNVTKADISAYWNEAEAKILLNAIEGLQGLDDVTFWQGSRKWRKEEIVNFVRRMGDRIKRLSVYGAEDSPASASAGLHLSSCLEYLDLSNYPPVPSLSLPRTIKHLELLNMCPLPSSISEYPLPPLLEHLTIVLVPFFADGKTSILPTPFDFSHLTHLTELYLDGGEETSNLLSHQFFSTFKNATVLRLIRLEYCVVGSLEFPRFARWFVGDESIKIRKRVNGNGIR